MGKPLTVVITTWNRREFLLRQLLALQAQGHRESFCVLVEDNCSDYDIAAALDETLEPEFRALVSLHRRQRNLGGNLNIALSFADVQTQWMWLLSDDDTAKPDAIATLLADADAHPDCCFIKYSAFTWRRRYDDCHLDGLLEALRYFRREWGPFIGMSFALYNLPLCREGVDNILEAVDTYTPHIYPPLLALKRGGRMWASSYIPVGYTPDNVAYSARAAFTAFPMMLYKSRLALTGAEKRAFKRVYHLPARALYEFEAELPGSGARWQLWWHFAVSYWPMPAHLVGFAYALCPRLFELLLRLYRALKLHNKDEERQ